MTSEKTVASATMSPLAAIALKLVGIITILSALIDYVILFVAPDLTNPQWQLSTTTQLVDRGIVPLVGMALLLTGLWIDNSIGRSATQRSLWTDLRFWVCLLASVLGLVYLLVAPWHLNTVRLTSKQALNKVSQDATQAASQLEQRLSNELSQQQTQLGAVLQNDELLSQAIQSGRVPKDIEKFKGDPEGLNQFLQQRADKAREQIQTEIGSRRTEAEKRVKIEAWKSGIRFFINSLLLAVGYCTIGWLGLRRLLSLTRSA